jgi:hypothetical protein
MNMQVTIIKRFLALICLSAMLTGCKTLYDFKGYSKSDAKGVISDDEWTYSYAYTDPEARLSDGQSHLIVLVTASPKNACPDKSERVGDGREVIIAIDGKTGEMKIGGRSDKLETEDDMFTYVKPERQASVAFFDPDLPDAEQYKFARSGKVRISILNKEIIEGSVLAKINRKLFVNGKFRAKVCKYGQVN